MLDCFKKVRESRNKRRRTAAREDMAAEAEEADVEDPPKVGNKRARLETGRPVMIYILYSRDQVHHPAGKWNWDVVVVKTLGVIYELSLNDLHLKVSSHLPDGQKVREIIEALEDAGDIEDVNDTPADATHIRSYDELDTFLRLTEAKPIKKLVILHRKRGTRANSALPAGGNLQKYYFDLKHFDGPEYYVDEVEDSDEELGKRAGGKKGVPRKDHKFEETLEDIRRRIRRQEELLATMEEMYKAAFPAAIHGSDPGGNLRKLCYGVEDNLSGKDAIRFRTVVAAYLADMAARRASEGRTEDTIREDALEQVKREMTGRDRTQIWGCRRRWVRGVRRRPAGRGRVWVLRCMGGMSGIRENVFEIVFVVMRVWGKVVGVFATCMMNRNREGCWE